MGPGGGPMTGPPRFSFVGKSERKVSDEADSPLGTSIEMRGEHACMKWRKSLGSFIRWMSKILQYCVGRPL